MASDGTVDSNIGTVTITVTAVNDAPTANDGNLTTDEDTAMAGTLSANDLDSAALTVSLVDTINAHGTVTITDAATGAFSYTPDANFNGSASFTFVANDGAVDSNIGTVTITVNAVNDVPVASDGNLTTLENSPSSGTLSSSDLDGDSLTYRLLSTTNAHGTVTLTSAATGAFRYTPDKNFSGLASFTFVANDGVADSSVGIVTIPVTSFATRDLVYTATGTTLLTVTVVSGKLRVKIGLVVQPDVDPATVRSISFNGGTGRDSINLTGLSTSLYWHVHDVTINGGGGNDTLIGGLGRDNLKGGTGNNVLSGDEDNDTLAGEGGTDSLIGGAGVDSLLTGESNSPDGVFFDAAFLANLDTLLAACP